MSKGHWYCENCDSEIHPSGVTFDELHSQCGCQVKWITESGNQYVDHLDKDEPVEKFVQGSGFTHWRKLPNPPNTDTLKPI